ncbi:MAG: hypothetical protein IJ559_00615 [Prevotella sp.]|nr:hypothetical protein [Prevotella sp.]
MKKKLLLCQLWLLTVLAVGAQTVVTAHWPLDKSIKDMAVGSEAYDNATAATFSCEGTDVSRMLTATVAFGSKWNFQAEITPANYITKETGLRILRFKSAGASDGSDDYGAILTLKPNSSDLTFVPTKVSLSIAAWTKDGKDSFEVLLRKLNAAGEESQSYRLGVVKSHTDVNAQYDDLTYDVPAEATASNDAWQVVVRMVSGYNNQIAVGNIKLVGIATLGGTVQTSSFRCSVVPDVAGMVTPASTSVVTGDNVTCTATANVGYAFEGWYVGGSLVASDNPHTFTIAADTQVEAHFIKLPEATLVWGTATPQMGSVSATADGVAIVKVFNTEKTTCNAGTTVTLTAAPAKGHYFVRWVDGDGRELSTAQKYTFKLSSDMTVMAVFALIDNYRADIVAFPGAEGYGRFTTGGRMTDQRGAKVYYVTRLDDSGAEGTFRWAVTTGDDTPRTVVFKTCGTIYLTSRLTCKGNITIAGQTAPGGGICIAGYQLKLSSNSIVRHIRFRTGDLMTGSMSPLDIENVSHVVLDHCSLSWSMEENMTLYDTDSTTVQWCISAEGLYYSKNVKGERSYGMQWGGEHGTMHHCLIANSMSRMPRFNGVRNQSKPQEHDLHVDNEFANNVIFNWGSHNSIYGGEQASADATAYNRVYMINNYYRPGPATKIGATNRRYFVSASGDNTNQVGQWLLSGNKFELSSVWAPSASIWKDTELEKVNQDNYYGFVGDNGSRAMNFWSLSPSQALADKALFTQLPYTLSGMQYESADDAFVAVTTKAGASLPRYDEVDQRLVDEAAGRRAPQFRGASFVSEKGNGTITPAAGIINSPADITLSRCDEFYALDEATGQTVKTTIWPWLGMDDDEQLMKDSDQDGMPDGYEQSVGLNPNDATDGYRLTESGYSNLELFLNGVADGTIDLTPYKTAPAVEKRQLFNAVVDPTDVAAFKTIGEAVADAEKHATAAAPYYILVKAGTYNEHVEISKPFIHLTGVNREQVVITDNRSKSYAGNLGTTATVYVNADDVSLDNLTINNTYGQGEQALALYTLGDRITVTQCHINGWQDTYRTGKSGQRHLVRECCISGTTDFIYNAGDVYFDRDTLQLTNTTNVIVAPCHINPTWGYVFRDAYICGSPQLSTLNSQLSTDLGRPWGDTPMVSFIDTRLGQHVRITDAGWRDMDGLPVQMAEYNTVDAAGQTVDLSKRKTSFTAGGKTTTSKSVLTEAEAAAYTIQNVLSGSDQWDADAAARILPEPSLTISGNQLTWRDTSGRAACYLVVTNGQATVTTAETAAYTAGSTVSLQCVNENGVLGRPVTIDAKGNVHSAITAVTRVPSSDAVYGLSGLRLSQPRQGVNIISGRKVLVR